jgi:hypothetical protein
MRQPLIALIAAALLAVGCAPSMRIELGQYCADLLAQPEPPQADRKPADMSDDAWGARIRERVSWEVCRNRREWVARMPPLSAGPLAIYADPPGPAYPIAVYPSPLGGPAPFPGSWR